MADIKSSEGKVIGGGRMCGKSTELIRRASEEQLYILCANRTIAKIIFKQAQDMGHNIPHPITIDDLPLRGYMKEVLVDEVEMVLRQLIGKRVVTMSTSYQLEELPSLRDVSPKTNKTISARTLTVDVDCSDAIKGLKAVQREARKTVVALKEVDEYRRDISGDSLD